MNYSIGEVAKKTNITVSTLRYYDREGMFPTMERSAGGIRIFSQNEVNTIKVIECLKAANMPIKDIKEFLIWCQQGDASLQKRQELFHERYQEVEKQMQLLQDNLNTLKYKCWYYDTAVALGSEKAMKELSEEKIPIEIRNYKI